MGGRLNKRELASNKGKTTENTPTKTEPCRTSAHNSSVNTRQSQVSVTLVNISNAFTSSTNPYFPLLLTPHRILRITRGRDNAIGLSFSLPFILQDCLRGDSSDFIRTPGSRVGFVAFGFDARGSAFNQLPISRPILSLSAVLNRWSC